MRLSLTIDANTGQLRGQLDNASRSVGGFADHVETSSQRANRSFSRTRQGIASVSGQLERLQRIATGAFVLGGIREGISTLVEMSDTYTNTTARLHLATKSQEEYNTAYRELTKITRESRGDFTATIDLYSTMSRATQDLGLKQSTLLTVTDAVNKAIRVSGANSESAQAALVQLGQGLASGTLRGEELNSVLEQTPRIARMIADGAGIAFGDLRKVAAQGGLTSEVVIRAIQKEAATVSEEFSRMPPTIAEASLQIHNSMIQIWGDFTTTSGASNGLASSILFLADNMKAMVFAGITGIKILAAAYIGKLISAKFASIAATRAEQAATLLAAQTAVASAEERIAATRYLIGGTRQHTAAVLELAAAERTLAAASASNNVSMSRRIGLSRTGTRASLAGLGKMAVASNLLFAAWAGWEIGTYLSEQFSWIKQSGIAMAGGLSKIGENIYYAFKLAWAKSSNDFNVMIATYKSGFANIVEYMAKMADKIPFMSDKAKGMHAYAKELQDSVKVLATTEEITKKINAERDKNIKANEAFYAQSFADAGKPKTKGQPQGLPLLAGNGVKQSIADSQSLITQLNTAFDDSFTKISDKYVSTWQALVKTQGEGTAQVKALEDAYQAYVDGVSQKEVEKAKAKAKSVIDIHSAKFAKMQGLGAVAFGSEQEKLQAGLQLKTDMLNQEEARIVAAAQAQGANVKGVRAYFDEQRINAAQTVADKLSTIEQDKIDKSLAKKQQEIDATNALIAAGEQAGLDLKGQFQQAQSANQQVNLQAMQGNMVAYSNTLSTLNEKTGKREISWSKSNNKQKVAFVSAGLEMVSGLMKSHNRKQFEIGKAAAAAKATISGIAAVMETFSSMGGFPWGVIPAGIMAGVAAANVSKILSTPFGGSGGASTPTVSAGGGGASPTVAMNAATGLPKAPAQKLTAQPVHITIKSDTGFIDPNAAQKLMADLAPFIADANQNGMGNAVVA